MDILLVEQGDGGEVLLRGGDVCFDNGLYTSVYVSLFGGETYANIFDEDVETDNDFANALNQTITLDVLREIEAQAMKSLDWMLKDEVASEITVNVASPQYNMIDIEITIIEKSGKVNKFSAVWDSEKLGLARFVDVSNGGYGL